MALVLIGIRGSTSRAEYDLQSAHNSFWMSFRGSNDDCKLSNASDVGLRMF
jgi:hypothetical protein